MMRSINTITTSLLLAVFGLMSGCQKHELNDILKPEANSSMKQQSASTTNDGSLTCYSNTTVTSTNGNSVTYIVTSCYSYDGIRYVSPDYPTTWNTGVEREIAQVGVCVGDPEFCDRQYAYVSSELQLTPGPTPTEPQNFNCTQQRSSPQARRTLGTFVMDNYGATARQCLQQRGWFDKWFDGTVLLPKGPTVRFVRDPLNPNIVIDMQRMLVLGAWGPGVANSVEIAAAFTGADGYNGYNDRDYYSLQLGYDFYANYSSQLTTTNTNFADLVADFLNDPTQRTAYTDGSKCR